MFGSPGSIMHRAYEESVHQIPPQITQLEDIVPILREGITMILKLDVMITVPALEAVCERQRTKTQLNVSCWTTVRYRIETCQRSTCCKEASLFAGSQLAARTTCTKSLGGSRQYCMGILGRKCIFNTCCFNIIVTLLACRLAIPSRSSIMTTYSGRNIHFIGLSVVLFEVLIVIPRMLLRFRRRSMRYNS